MTLHELNELNEQIRAELLETGLFSESNGFHLRLKLEERVIYYGYTTNRWRLKKWTYLVGSIPINGSDVFDLIMEYGSKELQDAALFNINLFN